ncbi:MAG: serine/threonine-protein kinase PknK [Frankiaceae bacterium]|nr:serine/threonine-protein kinase PknK [Frankiaceae bacterium]
MASYDELVGLGYRDLTLLGQGGFGTVYGAHDPAFGRRVALKVIETRLDDDAERRFDRERRAVAALPPHPHIVNVYSIARTSSGMPVFVMELVTGGTLAERIGSASWQEAFRFGVQLSGALETAHRAGVIHRDVKPDNVLLGNYGEAKISDFGIATLTGSSTTTAAVAATLSHAAPEILSGRPATASSDVYSLASTLYTLIAGHSPFVSGPGGMPELIARITTQPAPSLAEFGVPQSAAAVIDRALAKDAADRPRSAAEFGAELVDALRAAGADAPALAIAGVVAPASDPVDANGEQTDPATVIGRRGRATPMLPPQPGPTPHARRRVVAIVTAAAAIAAITGVAIAQPWHHGARQLAQGTPVSSTSPSSGATSTSPVAHKPSPRSTATKHAPSTPPTTPASSSVPVVPSGSTAPAAGNHAPTLTAVAAQTTNERKSVSLRLAGADADHNSLTYALSGALPAGLSLNRSTGVISGTISVSAASVTTNYTSIKSRVFRLTAMVSDGKATASRSFTWTVRDTTRYMPNYYNAYGCGNTCSPSAPTDSDKPSIKALGPFGTTCTSTRPSGITDTDKIVYQSIAAGAVFTWGTHMTYEYYPCH